MSKYSPEVKAAVMAALLTGQSISSVAKEYDIPKGTVSSWKNKKGSVKKATQKKADEIGVLLIDVLFTNLEAIKAQSEFTKDVQWLKKQTASDLAVLYGVMTDKSIRLLEAMSNAAID